MKSQPKTRALWVGRIEVRSPQPENKILEGTKGAFVDIVTWATDPEEFRRNAELVLGKLDLFIAGLDNLEPIEIREKRSRGLTEEIEEMVSRAQNNPHAIIYGTFHTYEKDDS